MQIEYETDEYVVKIDYRNLDDIWRKEAKSSLGMPIIVFDENDDLTKYGHLAGEYKEDVPAIVLFPDAHIKKSIDAEDAKKSLCQTLAHEFSHALCLRGALRGVKAKIHNFAQTFLKYRLLWYWLPIALFTWFKIMPELDFIMWPADPSLVVVKKLLIALLGFLDIVILLMAMFLIIILLGLLAAFTREIMAELLARSLIKKYNGEFGEAVDVILKPTL